MVLPVIKKTMLEGNFRRFLISKGIQIVLYIVGSRVTAILVNGWIVPIGKVALGRVCACSLRSRLVFVGQSKVTTAKGAR